MESRFNRAQLLLVMIHLVSCHSMIQSILCLPAESPAFPYFALLVFIKLKLLSSVCLFHLHNCNMLKVFWEL